MVAIFDGPYDKEASATLLEEWMQDPLESVLDSDAIFENLAGLELMGLGDAKCVYLLPPRQPGQPFPLQEARIVAELLVEEAAKRRWPLVAVGQNVADALSFVAGSPESPSFGGLGTLIAIVDDEPVRVQWGPIPPVGPLGTSRESEKTFRSLRGVFEGGNL